MNIINIEEQRLMNRDLDLMSLARPWLWERIAMQVFTPPDFGDADNDNEAQS